ncbi:bile acid:sodium symporter family protein [Micromonospora endolithica]|uniref:Bile acid:sodium symporter family protein n=1 Tax=Micromonospora endolithica TaxID=230091 RepID=A0A3A9ZAM7_9ACTN|nr:bile acid:sodium symporter family protein [Micromonospora endolithica]RKN45363.1 bile acid:sodium symporter family protein [Micromonospora endolithica]TWJ22932.1 BASS family bile acid:Na+ symporter [Micromonospora endolithica]
MDSALTLIGLPVALGIIMLGLGLGLTTDDFRRVARHPKAAVIALVCQLLVLPALCFGLVLAFDLPPALAVGMMLLAASPGGTTANLYSHLFGGNVALNIALTAINSVLAVFILPIVVNLSAAYFLDDGRSIGLQFDKVLQVFAIVLLPVAVGMLIRARASRLAARLDRPVRILSVVVLVAVIAGAVLGERENIADYFVSVGLAVLAFNLLSLTIGYGVPRLAGVDRSAATAAGFEIGIHNSTLAITIALSPALLDSTQMAIPAAVYGIVMFFTAAAFGYLVTRRATRAEPLQ